MHQEGPVPLYYQLELLLREQIETGILKPGGALPSENELAEQFKVSRITVRRALDRLEEDGLIIRRRGARTVLSPHISPQAKVARGSGDFRGFEDEMRRLGMSPHALLLESTIGAAPPSVAGLLQIPAGEEAVRIRRLGKTDGQPLWIESRYFPLSVGRALLDADPARHSILVLISELGLQIHEVKMHVQAVLATPRQAQLLEVAPGSPLLLHESITFVEGQRPVQVLRAYLRADRYQLVLTAAPRPDRAGLTLSEGGYLVSEADTGPRDHD